MFVEGMWGMHWGWWIFWIGAIIFAALIMIRSSRNQSMAILPSSPLEILQRRYASGEITTEEYEERKSLLKRDRF